MSATKFAILARDIESGYVSVHSTYDKENRAGAAKDRLAWQINKHKVTTALKVVEI